MKTTEQKAKAYDEAIERARIWQNHLYETNDKDYADELNYIFPELAEFEDERIKKELIEHIKANQYADYVLFKKFSPDDIIAWLEKQPIMREKDKWLIDETLYFLDEFQQSDRCYSENEMQNSITCKNWLKSLK